MKFLNWQGKAVIVFVNAFLVVVSSCTPETEQPEQQSSVIFTSTPTVIPATVTPSSTSISLSPTIEPTQSITVDQSCLSLEEQLPPNIQLTGVWIRRPGKPYLENFDEKTKYRIPLDGGGILGMNWGGGTISPNGKWLAYLDTNYDTSGRFSEATGSTLRLIHSSGHALYLNDWPVNFQKIDGWVDDQHLLIELNYFSEVHRQVVVLNPFSGEWKHVEEPDWFQQVLIERRWNESVVYSPNLKQVILHLKDHSELRDFETGNLLFGSSEIGFFGEHGWSTDNSMLALFAGRVLYIFQDGIEVLQSDLVKNRLVTNTGIRTLSWSMDHSKLLLETYDESLVFDLDQHKVFPLCFANERVEYVWWSKSFLYAVSGEFLVTTIAQEILPNHAQQKFEVLIDIKNKRAYKLAESIYDQDRIGWLESP